MRILVTGAGGFIGGHLCRTLAGRGNEVMAVDIKRGKEWWQWMEHDGDFHPCTLDLRVRINAKASVEPACFGDEPADQAFHLAADMGGMGHIGDKSNDCAVMMNNAAIDLNVLAACGAASVQRVIYSSSACVYNEQRQSADDDRRGLVESEAYPAWPDLEYGWQKLFSERLLRASGLNGLAVRLHNVYGPHGSWTGGREKAPAAICRKVAEAKRDGKHEIEVWGDGKAIRSYLYVDDCVEGLIRLAATNEQSPINLGSERAVSVDELVAIVGKVAGWEVTPRHVPGPQGVRSRNADITALRRVTKGWEPKVSLEDGLEKTFRWISDMVNRG